MAKKLGVLWVRKKENRTYFTGMIEMVAGLKTPIVVFKNDRKLAGSNQPDWNIMLSEPKRPKQDIKEEKSVDENPEDW